MNIILPNLLRSVSLLENFLIPLSSFYLTMCISSCGHARSKRRLLLLGKRLRTHAISLTTGCSQCCYGDAELVDANTCVHLCPKHVEGQKVVYMMQCQVRGVCRLNRRYRNQYLQHRTLQRVTVGTGQHVQCPLPSFPFYDYRKIYAVHRSVHNSENNTYRATAAQAINRIMFTSHNVGLPNRNCSHCGALVWYDERVKKDSTISNPVFSICCQKGKLQLPEYKKCRNIYYAFSVTLVVNSVESLGKTSVPTTQFSLLPQWVAT